jgi:soluble lytic murein transglycosylase-like protein
MPISTGILSMNKIIGTAAIILTGITGLAEAKPLNLSTKSRVSLFRSQTSVLDGRAASQYSNSVRLQPKPVIPPSKGGTLSYSGRYSGPYLDMARSAARRHGVPEDLFLRLIQQESGWNHRAKSHKGALGLAQLMPATARRLNVNPRVPRENLEGGARYLRQQYDRFRSWRLALAAYNAGPEAVQKYGGVPPYRETKNYVRKIWGS